MVRVEPLKSQSDNPYYPTYKEKVYDKSSDTFIVKDVKYVNIKLPYGTASDWGVRRYVIHWVRSFFELFYRNLPKLQEELDRVEDRGRQEPWDAPDGRRYEPGEMAYWVPQHGHAPFGVCPWCLWLEETFRYGGKPWEVWKCAFDPRHLALHVRSLFPHTKTGCYCQIMPYREAIGYGAYFKPKKHLIGDNEIVDDQESNEDFVIDRYADKIAELALTEAEMLMNRDKGLQSLRVERRAVSHIIETSDDSIFDEGELGNWGVI